MGKMPRMQGLRDLEHPGTLSPAQFDKVMAQFAGTQPDAGTQPPRVKMPARTPGRLENQQQRVA